MRFCSTLCHFRDTVGEPGTVGAYVTIVAIQLSKFAAHVLGDPSASVKITSRRARIPLVYPDIE